MTTILSKTELMDLVIREGHHESFEHETEGVFDVTLMRGWAARHLQPVTVLLSDLVPFIRESRVTDAERVMSEAIRTSIDDPGLIVLLNDGKHLLIDGHHRALRRDAFKMTEMLMYIVPEDAAIRPGFGWGRSGYDWGDPIVDGKIIRGGGA